MYKVHASNAWILGLTIVSMLATAVVLYFVLGRWENATLHRVEAAADSSGTAAADTIAGFAGAAPGDTRYPSERDVLLMIVLMGGLGGLVHLTSSLAKYVGNRQLLRGWIVYYLLMPVEGAALAPMVYLLLRAGVLAAPQTSALPGTSSLNVVVLYGFAGLTGLFSKQAIEMLADVFATIFKRVRAKDAIEQPEAPGTGGSSAGRAGGT